jgi:aryl-alcohol dehydrogenase-like predicted oxidoreductase
VRNLGIAREEIVIATKAFGRIMAREVPGERFPPNSWGLSRKHLFDAVDASLKRLQMDYIDLYQIHAFDPLTPLEETLGALDDIVKSGRVRYIGLCNLAAWQIAKALRISERQGLARFDSLQMYYSIAGRELEREIAPLAVDEGLAILPWSPLAGGFLSGKYTRDGAPSDSRRAQFDFPPIDKDKAYDIIEVMARIGGERGASVAQIALAWLLHQQPVTSVIIGAKTIDQLNDNLAATEVRLSAQELAQLDGVSALKLEYPGWMLERQGGERRDILK